MAYTHPHMKVARMEAAIEMLGSQIGKLSAAIDDERNTSSPNQATIAGMQAERSALRDRQDELQPDELDAVAYILGEKVR